MSSDPSLGNEVPDPGMIEPGCPYITDPLEEIVGPPGPEVLDQDEYPDYDENDSRVISGPLGAARFPGTRMASWREAESYSRHKYKVIKFWVTPGRWYARIRVTRAA